MSVLELFVFLVKLPVALWALVFVGTWLYIVGVFAYAIIEEMFDAKPTPAKVEEFKRAEWPEDSLEFERRMRG